MSNGDIFRFLHVLRLGVLHRFGPSRKRNKKKKGKENENENGERSKALNPSPAHRSKDIMYDVNESEVPQLHPTVPKRKKEKINSTR